MDERACKRCTREFVPPKWARAGDYCSLDCYRKHRTEEAHRVLRETSTRDTDECIPWRNASRDGYGGARVNGRSVSAHRGAYILAHGEIPPSVVVRHRCDNPLCVNIRHLEAGSQYDNRHDCISRGRARYARGEESGTSVLKEEQVRIIKGSPLSARELSETLSISRDAIYRVRQGRTWRHV